MDTITLKHGEKKILKFTYTAEGVALSIEAATLTLVIRPDISSPITMTVANASFTKSANIARCNIDTTSLAQDAEYLCELKAVFGSSSIDKSDTFMMKIQQSIDGA
jgi:hypothetical protein